VERWHKPSETVPNLWISSTSETEGNGKTRIFLKLMPGHPLEVLYGLDVVERLPNIHFPPSMGKFLSNLVEAILDCVHHSLAGKHYQNQS